MKVFLSFFMNRDYYKIHVRGVTEKDNLADFCFTLDLINRHAYDKPSLSITNIFRLVGRLDYNFTVQHST
jgi:hypothetical protein